MAIGFKGTGMGTWSYTGREALLPLVCGLLFLGALAQASQVPFDDTFYTYPNGISLDGTNGWSVSGTGEVTAQGESAQIVNSDTNDVTFANTFDDEELAVSMSYDVRPVYSKGVTSGDFPPDSTFVFYVDTNGIINAYNGGAVTVLVHDAISDQFPTNFQVQLDYVISKWSISVGSVEVASDLGFYSSSNSTFSELGFIEIGVSATSIVDNVHIEAAIPATTTTAAVTTTTTTVAVTTSTTTTAAATTFALPFEEPFNALTLGALNGQRDWVSTDAAVQSAVTRGGYACSITNQSGKIEHTFIGGHTNIWTQLDVRPVHGEPRTAPPAGTTFAYYVNSNGVVVAYNGKNKTELPGTFVPVNTWVRFETHSDYANTNWDLYLNSRLIAEDLGFYNGDVTGLTKFSVYGVTSGVTYVDNIHVGESRATPPGSVLILR